LIGLPTGLDDDPFLIRSFDDTFIAVRQMGEGTGLPLLVVNAVAANLAPWRLVLGRLATDGPIVTWDHRGTFESGMPANERLDVEAQALDGLAVMDALGHKQFVMATWSSGGRIALELAHRFSDRVSALALISTGAGYALTRFLRYLELPSLLPYAAGIAKRFASPLQGALHGVLGRPELAGLVRQAGMTSASADISSLVELVRGIGETDIHVLLETYEEIAGDPATDLLPEIETPTLVVAGEHDQFIPRRMTEELVAALPNAELLVYEDATHYLPMEHPAPLAEDLRAFYARVT
jgi:pimeloyl-ACP methyl ester carboxylesterase